MSERRYAVLIANSKFPSEPKLRALRAPENDVDGLNEVFTSKELGGFAEVRVLKNESSYDVQNKILAVLKHADRSDFVVIYYSGHGKLDVEGSLHLAMKDTAEDRLEATSIPITTIWNYVKKSPCNRVALILDCCYSGAAGKDFVARGEALEGQMRTAPKERGIYVMTASTEIQIAQEKETDQYGLFTKHIVEGIRTGDADLDQDGEVSMNELSSYVERQMKAEGFQTPMYWELGVRGEAIIARTGKSPREDRNKAIRNHITRLADEGILPDSIVVKAFAVVHEAPTEASDSSRRYRELLEKLVQGRLQTGDFIEEWYKVAGPPPISEEEAAATSINSWGFPVNVARRNSLKYYVYISDAKVNMLYEQIGLETGGFVASDVGRAIEFAKTTPHEGKGTSALSKLEKVVEAIYRSGNVGTIDEPKEYVAGTLSMRWGPNFPQETGFVYFTGNTDRTIVGLGGSDIHLMDRKGDGMLDYWRMPRHSYFPAIIQQLRIDLGDRESASPASEGYCFSVLEDVNKCMLGPTQQLEFLAKTLLCTHGKMEYNSWRMQRLLGSPVYVALAG